MLGGGRTNTALPSALGYDAVKGIVHRKKVELGGEDGKWGRAKKRDLVFLQKEGLVDRIAYIYRIPRDIYVDLLINT